MAFEDTPLFEEVKAIVEEGNNPVHAKWRCLIFTPEGAIRPLKFISMDIERDYINNYCDYVTIDVLLDKGTYTHDLIPFKQQLMVEITREPTGEMQGPPHPDDEMSVKQYRAIMHQEKDDTITLSQDQSQGKYSEGREPPIRMHMQLLPAAVEQLQLFEIGGIYRNEIPGDVIRYVLTHLSSKMKLEEEDKIIGVDKVEWDNQTPHTQVVIPQGTRVQDMPALIQDDWGGVYNTGMGVYLQDNLWYLWPEYNTKRFDKEERVLLIVNVPPLKFRGSERTWRYDEYQLTLISTGEVSHLDFSHHIQLNEGNATRHTHTNQMWEGVNEFDKNFGWSTLDNKFHFKRADNSSEYVGIRRPNYNVPRMSSQRLANNSFAEASRMAKRKGAIMNVSWENSRPENVFPGMPVRFMYLKDHEVQEVDGVILKAHHYIHDPKPGPIEGKHLCNTALTLFLEKVEEEVE